MKQVAVAVFGFLVVTTTKLGEALILKGNKLMFE
jgi:hypothetical protein